MLEFMTHYLQLRIYIAKQWASGSRTDGWIQIFNLSFILLNLQYPTWILLINRLAAALFRRGVSLLCVIQQNFCIPLARNCGHCLLQPLGLNFRKPLAEGQEIVERGLRLALIKSLKAKWKIRFFGKSYLSRFAHKQTFVDIRRVAYIEESLLLEGYDMSKFDCHRKTPSLVTPNCLHQSLLWHESTQFTDWGHKTRNLVPICMPTAACPWTFQILNKMQYWHIFGA